MSETPPPLSDDQGLCLELGVQVPQATLEEIARALPAVDLVDALVVAMRADDELAEKFLVTALRGFNGPNSQRVKKFAREALRDIPDTPA